MKIESLTGEVGVDPAAAPGDYQASDLAGKLLSAIEAHDRLVAERAEDMSRSANALLVAERKQHRHELDRLYTQIRDLTQVAQINQAGPGGSVVQFDYHAITGPPFGVWRPAGPNLEVMVHAADACGTLRVRERWAATQRDSSEVPSPAGKLQDAPFVTESGEIR